MTIAWDTETEPFTEYVKAPDLVCVSWAASPTSAGLFKWNGEGLSGATPVDAFRHMLAQPSIGLNAPYDWAVVGANHPDVIPAIYDAYASDRVTDVGIRERLFDIAHGDLLRPEKGKPHPYSLGALSHRILGESMDKGEDTFRRRYHELKHVPLAQWPEEAVTYARNDATAPFRIWQAQESRPYAAEILAPQYRECRADWWLHLIHCWGFRTDQNRLEAFAREVGDEHRRLEEILTRVGIIKVKIVNGKTGVRVESTRNVSAVRARLESVAARTGLKVKGTAGGQISTDADTCKMLGEHDPVLKTYARISSLVTLQSTYVDRFRGAVEIHPNYDALNLNGRTSSYDPNVQNPPRIVGIRESIVARPGHVIIDNDYPQIELRTWAQICLWLFGYSRMAEVLNADGDPHLDLGARILSISYEEAMRRYKEEKANEGGPSPVSNARQTGKPGNFGYMGGMGWETFIGYAREQYDIILDELMAKRLHSGWRECWPEHEPYFAWIRGAHTWHPKLGADGKPRFSNGRPIRIASIRHFVSGMIRGGAVYTDACNNHFSGLAQVIGKEAMFQISRECYDVTQKSVLLGCRPINWVHDQCLVETPEDDIAHDRAMRVAAIMDQTAERILPDIKTKSEPCLARRWSKNAKAKYDARGRLVPWEEKRAA